MNNAWAHAYAAAYHFCMCGFLAVIFVFCARINAEPLPAQLSAAITAKIIGYEQKLSQKPFVTLWFFGGSALAQELENYLPKNTIILLNPVLQGPLPDMLVLESEQKNTESILEYVRGANTLTIANGLEFQGSNAAVILANDEGIPGIFVNLHVCKHQKLFWESEFLDWVTPI